MARRRLPLIASLRPDREGDARRRAAFWERAKELTPYVAIERRGDVFVLPTLIDASFFVDAGRSDFVVLERACAVLAAAERLAPGSTIVDVGAHIGTTTISALSQHGFARAVAIEPDPRHLPLLRANVALNGLHERVTVLGAALAGEARPARAFVQGSLKEGSYRWMKGRLADEPSAGSVAVETLTLEGLAGRGTVDPASTGLVWFDCSSCELQALPAAESFLRQRVPLVFTVRIGQFGEGDGLLARLRDVYQHLVDLRHPNLRDPIGKWLPSVRPPADLVALPEGKKVTDVLLY